MGDILVESRKEFSYAVQVCEYPMLSRQVSEFGSD